MKLSIESPEFMAWLSACQAIINKSWEEWKYATKPHELVATQGSKFIKVISIRDGGGQSVWAFIERSNGDVLKPASWATPAKHARGNLFDDSKGLSRISWTGPAYL